MKTSEKSIRDRLRNSLRATSVLTYIVETACTGFPDLLISLPQGNFLIELKVARPDTTDINLFEGIQLYHLSRLHHAFALIYRPGEHAELYRVRAEADSRLHSYELEKVDDVRSPEHLIEVLSHI